MSFNSFLVGAIPAFFIMEIEL